jgi:hypothetical protein
LLRLSLLPLLAPLERRVALQALPVQLQQQLAAFLRQRSLAVWLSLVPRLP